MSVECILDISDMGLSIMNVVYVVKELEICSRHNLLISVDEDI